MSSRSSRAPTGIRFAIAVAFSKVLGSGALGSQCNRDRRKDVWDPNRSSIIRRAHLVRSFNSSSETGLGSLLAQIVDPHPTVTKTADPSAAERRRTHPGGWRHVLRKETYPRSFGLASDAVRCPDIKLGAEFPEGFA